MDHAQLLCSQVSNALGFLFKYLWSVLNSNPLNVSQQCFEPILEGFLVKDTALDFESFHFCHTSLSDSHHKHILSCPNIRQGQQDSNLHNEISVDIYSFALNTMTTEAADFSGEQWLNMFYSALFQASVRVQAHGFMSTTPQGNVLAGLLCNYLMEVL